MKPVILRVALAIVLFAAAVVVSGCSTLHDPSETIPEPDAQPLPTPSLDYRVGVLPIMVDEDFKRAADATNNAQPHKEWAYLPDPAWRRSTAEEVVNALDEMRCFRSVSFIPGAEGRRTESLLQEAWDEGIDLVVRPVLRRRHCEHVESNGAHIPAMILWIVVLQGITWWMADETFASDTSVAVEFYSTGRRELSPVAVREVVGRVKADLDDFQQGFNLFNIFITPSGMSPGHWQDIGNGMLPLSRREMQRQFVDAASTPDGFAADIAKAREDLRKTLALLVSVVPEDGRAPRFADRDVERLRDVLLHGMTPPAAIPRGVRHLDGLRASRDAFIEGLDGFLARHARADDRLLVMLASRGVIGADGRGWLLFADSDPADPATGLPIAELAERLATLPGNVMVVSTVNWSGRQTSSSAMAPPSDPLTPLHALPGVAVFAATRGHGSVLEIEHARTSLFVDELVNALLHPDVTDTDVDGWLSWTEIAAAVRGPVESLSRMEGTPQSPTLVGDEAVRTGRFFRIRTASGTPAVDSGSALDNPGPDPDLPE